MSSAPFSLDLPPDAPTLSPAIKAAGLVTIVGFGSLLSRRSAGATFPHLRNFRPGLLRGHRRVFAHVAAIFVERGIANVETKEMSSLSVEPCADATDLVVCLFEIPLSDLPAFYQREQEFRWAFVPAYGLDGQLDRDAVDGQALACLAYSDEEYKRVRLGGSSEAFEQAYGRFGLTRVWRDDILPCPVYLRHVVLAAASFDRETGSIDRGEAARREEWSIEEASDKVAAAAAAAPSSDDAIVTPTRVSLPSGRVLSSFLDCTFLGDRSTSIRAYLRRHPEVLMAQPPESLKSRYSG